MAALSSPLGLVSFLAAAEREEQGDETPPALPRSLARSRPPSPGKKKFGSERRERKARSLVAAAVAMAQAGGNSAQVASVLPCRRRCPRPTCGGTGKRPPRARGLSYTGRWFGADPA